MKPLIICKSCGYVMAKSGLRNTCPACGVPAKMFEDYVDRVSPRRGAILALDIHPVLAHFPQAFVFTVLVLTCVLFTAEGAVRERIASALSVIAALLPFTVLLTFLGGLFDGRIRFHRVTTTILVRKMVLGSLFLLFSLGTLLIVLFRPLEAPHVLPLLLLVELGAFACSAALGFLGARLLNAKFPG